MYKDKIVNDVRSLRQKLSNQMGLPFQDILPAEQVAQAIKAEGVKYRDCLFTPWVTLWAFLAQVLDADGSCRKAVSRVVAYCAVIGLPIPSALTGGYCRARKRLSENLLYRLMRWAGLSVQEKATGDLLWCGRRVKIVDGSTVSMPDTPENQKDYPQHSSQAKGCGFPIARIVVFFGLATGTVVDLVFGSLHVGENILFRQLWSQLIRGDILLGDRGFFSYANIASLLGKGVDTVLRLAKSGRVKFEKIKQLGPNDQLVTWNRPSSCPKGMSREEFKSLPQSLTLRQVHFHIDIPGFRSKEIFLVTTLLDPVACPMVKLAELYRARWECELNLRDLKTSMQMEILGGKTPQMVRKEVYAHILAYNLVRSLMWNSATYYNLPPLRLSLKGSIQHLTVFAPLISVLPEPIALSLFIHLLRAMAETLPYRPNRIEPRRKKRRPKSYGWLQKSRDEFKGELKKELAA
jgi:hypothetical protein